MAGSFRAADYKAHLARTGDILKGTQSVAAAFQTRPVELLCYWLAVALHDEASCVLFSI